MKLITKIFNFLNKNQKKIRRIGLIIGFLLLIRQIFFLIKNTNFAYPTNFVTNVMVAFFFVLSALIFQIISWKFVMEILGIKIPVFGAIQGYMLSFLPKYIPGTIWGYASRNDWLKEKYGIDKTKTSIGSIIEVYLIFVSILNLILLYLAVQLNEIFLLLLFVILSILPFYLIRFVANTKIVKQRYPEWEFKPSLKNWIFALLFELIMWGCYGVAVDFLFAFLNFSSSFPFINNVFLSMVSFSLSWIIGFLIIFIPSGIGVREEILANLLVYQFNCEYLTAMRLAIILRLLISLSELFLSGLGLIRKKIKN